VNRIKSNTGNIVLLGGDKEQKIGFHFSNDSTIHKQLQTGELRRATFGRKQSLRTLSASQQNVPVSFHARSGEFSIGM